MGSNNSLAKIIFHLSLVNALTRGIKCIQRLGGGDSVVEIGSPASVGTVAGGLAEPPRGTPRPYIKTLMISDCSLFTMIPGFCTPVVQTRASPPASSSYGTATLSGPLIIAPSVSQPSVGLIKRSSPRQSH